ncbi:helix-turn-helix domain-containing protein [Gottfriedia sp. NPDC056225]|uniref:helix-turn-helix domain-containing protein n=1 Tax=Gottfriedia sp. NPDC056225 TaxID=3345751 RepID=UPI0035DE9EAE
MSIGKIIYYHRKKQKMKQAQLCAGICSITHLSKIENNVNAVASDETLQLLCERLKVSIEEENKKYHVLKEKLTLFYDAMERIHRVKADELYEEVLNHSDYIQCTDLIYLFELFKLRYLLFTSRIQEFELESKKMIKNITKLNPFELFLWEFLQAIYNGQIQMFEKSLEILSRLESQADQYSEKVSDFYFYKSVMHGNLDQHSLSIHYIYKVLPYLQDNCNVIRILHVKAGLSINLIYLGEFEKSEKILTSILNCSELLQDTNVRGLILHNFGFLNHKQGNFQKALEFYHQSLQFKQINTNTYYHTIKFIIDTHIELKQFNEAIKLLKAELGSIQNKKSNNYVQLKNIYLKVKGKKSA